MAGSVLTRSFPRYSNLHVFIDEVVRELLFEELLDSEDFLLLKEFIKSIDDAPPIVEFEDVEYLISLQNDKWFSGALDALVERIFSILFQDVYFLSIFNKMTTPYLRAYLEYESGEDWSECKLRRVRVPQFVKDAVYFRDRGECRKCKKDISRSISPLDKECFDHIVPLAAGGANDVSNIQLLCQPCNLSKAARDEPVSNLYPRAIPTKN